MCRLALTWARMLTVGAPWRTGTGSEQGRWTRPWMEGVVWTRNWARTLVLGVNVAELGAEKMASKRKLKAMIINVLVHVPTTEDRGK